MEKNNITTLNFAFLWFGAAISVAEIFTGGLLAPMGFAGGVWAILIGHGLGTAVLALGAYLGATRRLPGISLTELAFGQYGTYLFSILNVAQLLGWTAVMIITAARSVNEITKVVWSFDNMLAWTVVIGGLIYLWIALGREGGWKKLNVAAVSLLFFLTLALSAVVFGKGAPAAGTSAMPFGAGLELSAVMPLSWVPLVADYARFAATPRGAVAGTGLGYFIGSCWMYIIGLAAAIVFGSADPSGMMLAADLGMAALGIIVLSTVTTTFMDAYSAGVTSLNLFPRLKEKQLALFMTVIGTIIAVGVDIEKYESFLYAIGSVFGPLFAIVFADYFIGRRTSPDKTLLVNWQAVLVWAAGVWLYYQFIELNFAFGATLPVMVLTGVLHILTRRWTLQWKCAKKSVIA